jgi:tRNA threonylcarbamoyladenosine biosynthesis protein TsaB
VVSERAEEIGRGHAEVLAPMVEALLAEAGIAASALYRIGVNTGPGSFAGARVGVSFARGLALASEAKAVGVGLLPALALRADPARTASVLAIHDARRGDYLWSLFAPGERRAALNRGSLEEARTAAALVSGLRIVGSGAEALGGEAFDPKPPLTELLELTAQASADAPPPAPVYARPPDAKLPQAAQDAV